VKQQSLTHSAGFTYGLDRLKPRASKFRSPPANVNYIFNTVIGLSHLCCYNVLYFLNNPSVIFLTQLHSITKYCIILNSSHQSPVVQFIKHISIFLQSWRWGIRKGLTNGTFLMLPAKPKSLLVMKMDVVLHWRIWIIRISAPVP
jgi:hypothetical protein